MKKLIYLILLVLAIYGATTYYISELNKRVSEVTREEREVLTAQGKILNGLNEFIINKIEKGGRENPDRWTKLKDVMENSSQYMEQDSYFKIIESINGAVENGSESLNFEKKVYKQLLINIEESLKEKKDKKRVLMKEIAKIKTARDILVPGILCFIVVLLFFTYSKRKKEIKILNDMVDSLLKRDCEYYPQKKLGHYAMEIIEKLLKLRETMVTIDDIIKIMLQEYGVEETIRVIFENKQLKKYMGFNRIGFAKIDGNDIVATVSFSDSKESWLPTGYRLSLEKSSLKKIMESREIRVITDLEEYFENNRNSKSTEYILKEGFKSSLTMPLVKNDGKTIGFLFFSSFKKNGFGETEKMRAKSIAEIFSYIFEKNMLVEDLVTNTAISFVKLVEGKDPETGDHIDRMALYSEIIAKKCAEKYPEMNITHQDIEKIRKFAPLHDIGKVGIKDEILLKPGKLSIEEFELMKKHTVIGADVIKNYQMNLEKYNYEFMQMGYEIALYHHEKWNGKGYPEGLSGNDIPLAARIVSVADVFDAISSKRVYKEAFGFENSVEMIKEMSGENFQPEIVEAFIEAIKEIRHIYESYRVR